MDSFKQLDFQTLRKPDFAAAKIAEVPANSGDSCQVAALQVVLDAARNSAVVVRRYTLLGCRVLTLSGVLLLNNLQFVQQGLVADLQNLGCLAPVPSGLR
jgi:hypothetical protein